MYLLNDGVPTDVFKTFDTFVRTSKLRDEVGVLALSRDADTQEIVAAYKAFDVSAARPIARARAPENLFAQVLLILSSPE
jgi:hypothetical protein